MDFWFLQILMVSVKCAAEQIEHGASDGCSLCKGRSGVRLFMLVGSYAVGAHQSKLNGKRARAQRVCFSVGTVFSWETFKINTQFEG